MNSLRIIAVLLGAISVVSCFLDESNQFTATAVDNIIYNWDNETNIQELCTDTSDTTMCLRDFFQKHARCAVVLDNDDKPFRLRGKTSVYAPKANLTLNFVDPGVKNLKGNLEAFYVNKNTGNLIMSVTFTNFAIESRKAEVIVSQRSREPKIVQDRVMLSYPSITVTAVVPAGSNIMNDDRRNRMTNWLLEKSTISGYVPQNDAVLKFGSKFSNSEDPVISAASEAVQSDLLSVIEEFTFSVAPAIYKGYIQKYICSFGIPL